MTKKEKIIILFFEDKLTTIEIANKILGTMRKEKTEKLLIRINKSKGLLTILINNENKRKWTD